MNNNSNNDNDNVWLWRFLVISLIIIMIALTKKLCFDIDAEYKYTRKNHDLNKHLYYISTMLKSHEVNHWMMYDTLLSGVRINKISNIINDLDIGMYAEDAHKIEALNEIMKYNHILTKMKIIDYISNLILLICSLF